MKIVNVHYDNELKGVYGNDCTYLFDVSEKKLGEEVVKRINMHDELVSAINELKAFYDDRMAGNKEHQLSKEIEELLERCK